MVTQVASEGPSQQLVSGLLKGLLHLHMLPGLKRRNRELPPGGWQTSLKGQMVHALYCCSYSTLLLQHYVARQHITERVVVFNILFTDTDISFRVNLSFIIITWLL